MRRVTNGENDPKFNLVRRVEHTYKGDLRDFQVSVKAPAFKFQIEKSCRNPEENPIIVLGRSASGKTLLAKSIVGEMKKHGKSTYRMTCEYLTHTIVESIRTGYSLSGFIEELSDYDYVIIDEIEDLKGKDSTQHAVATVVQELVKHNVKVILLGLSGPNVYAALKETLASGNLTVREMIIPDMTRYDRYRFIKAKCRLLRLRLPGLAAWKISMNPNMGAITGMINTLAAFSGSDVLGYREKFTNEDIKKLLGERFMG